MFRTIALKIGFGRLLGWIRSAHDGEEGPGAQQFVQFLTIHAMWMGLVFGALVTFATLYWGADSQATSLIGGLIAGVLIPAGIVPTAWKEPPEMLQTHVWYRVLRNSSAEIGLLMMWLEQHSGSACVAPYLVHVTPSLGITVTCGFLTFSTALLGGALVQLGLYSSAKLAEPPKK